MGSQTPDDLPARKILELGRKLGDHIDANTVKRANEAVRNHERRHHRARPDEVEGDKIPDETIREVISQSEREGVSLAYACECHDVQWSRFVVDLADYEGRLRRELQELRWRS